MNKKFKIKSIFLVCLITMAGCLMSKRYYEYEIGIDNRGDKDIYRVLIESNEGFWFPCGVVSSKTDAKRSGKTKYPASALYTIVWIDGNLKKHKRVVNLKNTISENFSGELIFIVNSKNEISFVIK